MKPEAQARQEIDALLTQAGWVVQEVDRFNLSAARGVAIAEFPLSTGPTDYLLIGDGQRVSDVEARQPRHKLPHSQCILVKHMRREHEILARSI
jgi:type I site-specific restriction endonuclease